MADVFAPQPVKTKTAGDVVVNINAGQSVGLAAGSAIVGKVGIDQTTPGTTNAVQVTGSLPAGSALVGKVGIDQTTPGTTNGVQVNAALPTGANVIGKISVDQTTPGTTNGVQVNAALPAGANVIGKISIDQTTPGTTNAVQLTAGAAVIGALTANQSVNSTQIGGVAISVGSGASGTGTQRMILATDQPTIPVSQGLSFTTGDSGHLTSASLAAGATITLDGPQIASGVGKLFEASVSSSVAIKAQLGTWDGTTFTVKRTFFVPANSTLLYEPIRYDAITMATGATAKFRWSITNNDNSNAADVYASITQAIKWQIIENKAQMLA